MSSANESQRLLHQQQQDEEDSYGTSTTSNTWLIGSDYRSPTNSHPVVSTMPSRSSSYLSLGGSTTDYHHTRSPPTTNSQSVTAMPRSSSYLSMAMPPNAVLLPPMESMAMNNFNNSESALSMASTLNISPPNQTKAIVNNEQLEPLSNNSSNGSNNNSKIFRSKNRKRSWHNLIRTTNNSTTPKRSSSTEEIESNLLKGDIDKTRIYRAAEEAGMHSFGIIGVDVWLLGSDGCFNHSVFWVNPIFRTRHPTDALDRLEVPSHPHYVPPTQTIPGAGLAGYFWSLGYSENNATTTSSRNATSAVIPSMLSPMLSGGGGGEPSLFLPSNSKLVWRNLTEITSDPFQPPYERMKILEQAGFGKATGLAFNVMGHRGVVIYMARQSASERALNDAMNVKYLRMSAQHIGTASAMTSLRLDRTEARKQKIKKTFRRITIREVCRKGFVGLRKRVESSRNLSALWYNSHWHDSTYSGDGGTPPGSPLLQQKMKSCRSFDSLRSSISMATSNIKSLQQQTVDWIYDVNESVQDRLLSVVVKSKGSKELKPPPPVPWKNAIWTFLGAYITFEALFAFKHFIQKITDDEEQIILAPYGALLTLLYSLTAAPASQPRNIMYGQCICLVVAYASKVILMDHYHWTKADVVPLTTACGIAMMSKLGIPHPPAAASIVALFAEVTHSNFGIVSCLLLVVGNMIAILIAILFNNLSEKRQYPIYWRMDVFTPESPFFYKKKKTKKKNKKRKKTLPQRSRSHDEFYC